MTGPRFYTDVADMCADHLADGMHLHVASTMSRPNALVREVARLFEGRAEFTVSANAFHADMHALVMAGVVRHAITCFAGDTYPSPRPNPLYESLPQGAPFTVEEWSLLSLLQRLIAGATGAAATLTRSLTGSDLEAAHRKAGRVSRLDVHDPDGTLVLSPLRPDVTLVHATCADRAGNLYLNGPVGEGWWGALAAEGGVVSTVELVVDRPPPCTTSIPADRVLAITPRPFGALPQGLPPWPECGFDGYPDDYNYLVELAEACRTDATRAAWMEKWVRGGRTPVSSPAVAAPRRRARVAGQLALTSREQHAILAARAIADRALEADYRVLLAGIGTAHLATWLAADRLRRQGHEVQVHAELGLVDMRPDGGDVFLFAQRHVARCRSHAGTLDVLGGVAAGGAGRVLGVLSAGEIDAAGRINSSRTADGRFLVGSGGANDFASHVETLVVAAASPRRFVPEVSFVTCPGRNVRTVATQFGRLVRAAPEQQFELATWMPPSGRPDADPAATLSESTQWRVAVTGAEGEKPVTEEEIEALREFDPEGVYR
ncbi:CoA-transferase [Amycolatopsis thermoflava]|uniref:CoA-transferase n=1 Tax=Amycolatopsis thermoflava TaxID=84480 RepID=UPI0037F21C1B